MSGARKICRRSARPKGRLGRQTRKLDMTQASRRSVLAAMGAMGVLAACSRPEGSSASELITNSRASLDQLYATNPSAKALGDKAKGVLVFPNIVEGGLIVGAQGGKGVLFHGTQPAGFYSIGSA